VTITIPRSPVLFVGVLTGIVIGAAEWISGGGPGMTLVVTAIPIAYALAVMYLGRRYPAASVLAGQPADERWASINMEASAWALGVTAVVILGGFVWAYASDGPWPAFAFIGAVIALTYIGSVLYLQTRR
jgi:hypothetical protein